jgi:basic amino acid/polyamine antiporter, APA family
MTVPTPASNTPRLLRAIGRWNLAALTINNTIGGGILGLPGHLYALLGVWSLAACLAAGLLMSGVAACFAEAGSRFTRSGGLTVYALEAFGPVTAFTMGWLTAIKVLLSYATVMNLLIGYASALAPPLAAGWPRLAAMAVLTAALGWPIYRGVRLSALAHNAFTLCKLGLLLGFLALTLPALLRHGVPVTPLPAAGNWAPSLLLLVFAMGGLEATGMSAAETRDPARDIPFGLAAGMVCVVALYSAVLLACQATVPGLAHTERPLFDAAHAIAGPAGGTLIVVTGVISMAGVLFVNLFSLPRLLLGLAESGQAPALLARIHPVHRTPYVAVVLTCAASGLLCIGTSFLGALTASALIRLLVYAVIAASVIRLRARRIDETGRPLLLPGGKLIAVATALGCVALVAQARGSDIVSLVVFTAVVAAVGVLVVRKKAVLF